MSVVARVLKTIAVLGGVFLVWMALGVFAARHSVFYVGVLAAVVLPVSYWRRYRFGHLCAIFMVGAVALAASPVDLFVGSEGRASVRVLRAHYGLACPADRACYGCSVPLHPAKFAIVIGY